MPTDTRTDPVGTGSTHEPHGMCPACPHPVAAHDAVAGRFCAATAAKGHARSCLCSGKSAGMTYANSTRAPISGGTEQPGG